MIVKPVFLSDVIFEAWKTHGNADVTVSASYGVCRHLYQLSATSNRNYGKLKPRKENLFSLS